MMSFGATPLVVGMFCPKANDWAILISMFVGLLVYTPLKAGPGNTTGTTYYTPFAPDPQWIGLMGRFYALLTQVIITTILCCVNLKKCMPTPEALKINTTSF